jgi:hypothetical protein
LQAGNGPFANDLELKNAILVSLLGRFEISLFKRPP